MGICGISLEYFRKLASTIDWHGFNLFFGAGISRDAPTCGPIWSEMQIGFLSAVFDRMRAERWPVASEFPTDQEKIQHLDIRPELFWREILSTTGEMVVQTALAAAGAGPPNTNHAYIAALLKSGRCKWAFTTNFDEHVEAVLPGNVSVVIPTEEMVIPEHDSSTYVKLHGSIRFEETLSYTLEHYDSLRQRNERHLRDILSRRPLVIAGYSGYDTDVLPILTDIGGHIPWIVVIRHPGSPSDQPILQLADDRLHRYVIESSCPQSLHVLAEGLDYQFPRENFMSCSRIPASYYAEAAEKMPMHLCPMVLQTFFWLTGAWKLVRKYAWLTHDAVTDIRYRRLISELEYQRVHQRIAICLKLAGDSISARTMLNEAKASLEKMKATAPLSAVSAQIQAEALVNATPTHRGAGPAAKMSIPFTPADVFAAHLAIVKSYGISDKKRVFEANWQLGTVRRREGRPDLALEAFNEAAAILMDDVVTHLERGHFLLDFGGAAYEHAVKQLDEDLATQASRILRFCDLYTRDSADWRTNAQANLMLARLHATAGNFPESRKHILVAKDAVSRTGDCALLERIEQLARLVDSDEQELSLS